MKYAVMETEAKFVSKGQKAAIGRVAERARESERLR